MTAGGGDGAETSVDGGVGDETLVAKMAAEVGVSHGRAAGGVDEGHVVWRGCRPR